MGAAGALLTRRLGVKVESVEDIARALSGLKGDERGSVDYALSRREIIAAAREFGDDGLKVLPDAWQVTVDSDGIEYKALPATATQITDEAQGIVTAFVAVSGTEDKVADIIYDEALDYAKAARTPKGVWHHDWTQPIAKTLKVDVLHAGDPGLPREARGGVPWPAAAGAFKVEMQFNLGTPRGRDALSDVIFYDDEQEWSIGYRIPPGGAKVDKAGIRHIKQLVINEYSPVLFGAHPLTSTGSIKHEGASVWREADDGFQEEKGGTIAVYLSGSLEEQIDAVADAVSDYLQDDASGINMMQCWARVVGTFLTGANAGRVVFDVITYGEYDGEDDEDTPDLDDDDNYFSASWSTANGDVTLSNVQPVTVQVAVALKDDGTPEQRKVAEFVLGDRKADWAEEFTGGDEMKVGKVFSKKNLTAIRDAHAALGALLSAAEPKPAAGDDEGKADLPHPYLADNGVCGTCQQPATARVHGWAAKDEAQKASADAMKKKPHAYAAPESGSDCATCGQQSDSPMHNAAKDGMMDGTGTHEYQPGPDGACATCGSVMGDQIHEAPYPSHPMKADAPNDPAKAAPTHHTATDDGAWDGAAAAKNAKSGQDAAYYSKIFAFFKGGDPSVKSNWSYPHHDVAADGTPGAANVKGCQSAIGFLNGAGGQGAGVPAAQKRAVYNHLAAHLKDAKVDVPELKDDGGDALELKVDGMDPELVRDLLAGERFRAGV